MKMRWTIHTVLSVLTGVTLFSTRSLAAATEEALADKKPSGTIFNGQDVPPITVLEGPIYDDTIELGYWLVEAYSPYCGHCKSLAPKWQTLYEYYYTSDPVPASTESQDPTSSLNSFTRYYNLKFAKLDCVAFGTACSQINANSYPTIILFKNGQEIKRSEGDRDMKTLSKFVESCLELIKPGSRPKDGLTLPKVGAKEFYPPGTGPKPRQPMAGQNVGSSQIKLQRPSKPRAPNPSATSVPLKNETFKLQVTRTQDPWFIKFYAPWCGHCQRMAASWSTMAREMKDKLDIGEVNCDVEKRLCKEVGVQSYPTIVYFRGSERLEYDGMRGLGDLIHFADSAIDSNKGVRRVTLEDFEALEETEEVIFIYFYDHATTSEDMEALDRMPMQLINRAKLVKTDDVPLAKRFNIFTYPRLVVSRDGKVAHFDDLRPDQIRNTDALRDWMRSVWNPLVPELTAQNARDIMDDKYAVIGILDRQSTEFEIARKEIKNAATEWMDRQEQQFVLERQELRIAKQLRIEEAEDRKNLRALQNAKLIHINMNDIYRKEVTFAWIDAAFWERWIRTTFGITVKDDGDKVIINDHHNRRYWDTTSTGNPIVPSRTSILETLTQIYATPPRLASKPTGSSIARFFHKTGQLFTGHPWLCGIVGVVVLLVAVLAVGRRKRRRSFGSGGFFRLPEGVPGMSGIQGMGEVGGVNGKAD